MPDYEVVISRKRPLIGRRRSKIAFSSGVRLIWLAVTTTGPKIAEEYAISDLAIRSGGLDFGSRVVATIREALADGRLHSFVHELPEQATVPYDCDDYRGWPIFYTATRPELNGMTGFRASGPDPEHWRYPELTAARQR